MKQQLPDSFMLGTKRYKVSKNKKLPKLTNGRVYPAVGLIELSPDKSDSTETFWHEVTHAILEDMGHPWRNEAFVKAFSKRLTEVIRTAKFNG